MEAHKFKFPRTAHYYTLGQANNATKHFWIVCHGYGQLAKRFIYKFDTILNEETFVIAPEGFSRFYFEGAPGRPVGSSWMTREDRLDEIDDYANLLQYHYEHYLAKMGPDVQINLFGFSQGCATQIRWIMEKFPRFHNLVLWAGFVPEDLSYVPQKEYFQDKSIHFVYGTEDQFISPERVKEHEKLIIEQQLDIQVHTFEGKHRVDRDKLKAIAKLLYSSKEQ